MSSILLLFLMVVAAPAPSPSSSPLIPPVAAQLLAGGLSCMIISFVLNPMDVIKCRLQLQTGDSMKYRGFCHAFATIRAEEGVGRGLMKGITPSMIREASYSSIRMGLYDSIKGFIAPAGTLKDQFTLTQKILAGASSGALGAVIATPTDLVKIRFQAYTINNPNPYKNTFDAFATIFRSGGLPALYKGGGPTVVRAAILTSSQLSSYDQSKRWLIHSGRFSDNSGTHLLSSIFSGLVTATAVNPADVIKTRVMTDGHGLRYKNPLDCVIKTWRSEGIRAFFRGWLPNYMRLGPHFLVSLPLAEYIRTSLGADTF